MYSTVDLLAARDAAVGRTHHVGVQMPGPQPSSGHPGRPRIKELLRAGDLNQIEIATLVGCSVDLVRRVNRELKGRK